LAAFESLAHERAAVDRAERHVVPADVNRVLRVSRLEVELARSLRDLLENPVRVELDELPVDLLAGCFEQRDALLVRLRRAEVDAELADDAAPAALELLHRRLVEDLVARHLVDQQTASFSSCSRARSKPASPVSRISSGRPSLRAAASAFASSSGVRSWASQTTRS